jgi:hypothetical protein
MSAEQIREAQEALAASLPPETLALLKARGLKKGGMEQQAKSHAAAAAVPLVSNPGIHPAAAAVTTASAAGASFGTYRFSELERSKLRWTRDVGAEEQVRRFQSVLSRDARELRALRSGARKPQLHRGWAHPCHICTRTGLKPATSAPGLGRGLACWRTGGRESGMAGRRADAQDALDVVDDCERVILLA